MTTRRAFLSTAAGVGAAAMIPSPAAARPRFDDATWLTYAVNVELFWKGLPLLDRLKKVAEAGFTHYEFGPFKAKDIPALDKVSRERNLTPTQFTAYAGLADPARKGPFLEALDDAIAVAETLGVKGLGVVAGEVVKGLEREAMVDAVVDALKEAAERAKDHDITLLLEPRNLADHPNELIVSTKDAADVVDAVGSTHVKILFDVYHQQASEGNLSGNIRKHFDKIGYFQVADHPGRSQPGTGEINYPHILKLIHDLGYKDAIGLEIKPKGDPLEALKQVREADAAAKALPS